MRSLFVTLCACLISSLAIGQDAPTNKPAKPPRRTWHDQYAALLEFNRRTLVGTYDTVGKRDPKWDAQARALLEAMARSFTSGIVREFYWPEAPKTPAERLELGRLAVEAGCDDPLVLLCYAMEQPPAQREQRIALLRRALAGLKAGGYPPERVYPTARGLAGLTPDEAERKATADTLSEYRVKMLCGPRDDAGRRLLIQWVEDELGAPAGRKAMQGLVDALDKRPDADPWMRDVIAGRLAIRLAWDSRGSDVAINVTEKGWKGFGGNLAEARTRFTRAWKAAPHLPEAPTEMIVVSMGAGEELGEDQMEWFERALDAQADFAPAYQAVFTALLPRWGGSHKEIAEVGFACVEVGRYDTLIPLQFITAMEAINRDFNDWGLTLRYPGCYETFVKVMQGYASAKTTKNPDWYRSSHASAAWATERYDEAKQVLDALGDRAEAKPFQLRGAEDGRDAMSEVYAKAGPHAAALREADAAREKDDAATAAPLYAGVLKQLDEKDRGRLYVETRARATDAAVKFAAGEWVDVQPVKTLFGWKQVAGTWQLDEEGALVGTPQGGTSAFARHKALLWSGGMLGVDETFEISGRVAFATDPGQKPGGGGAVLVSDDFNTRGYVLADPGLDKVVYYFGNNPPMAPAELEGENDFVIRFAQKTVTVEVNGKPVAQTFKVGGDRYADGIRLGVGGVGLAKVKFTKLRLRKVMKGE